MPSRHWEPCQILEQNQARLTLRSPRQRLRRRMSMRAGEGLCFPIGNYQVFSPQFDLHCVSGIHRLGYMYVLVREEQSYLLQAKRSG